MEIKLSNSWYKGKKTTHEKQEVVDDVARALPALAILQEYLELSKEKAEKERVSSDGYSEPNWAYKQAHLNGQVEALEKILKFLPKNT